MSRWTEKIQAFLHDPPDKALKISQHEERARRIVESLGIAYSRGTEDILASAVQRVVFDGKAVIDFYGKSWGEYRWIDYPHLKLPVSAEKVEYTHLKKFVSTLKRDFGYRALDEFIENVLKVEVEVAKNLFEHGYLKLWNFYPEELKKRLAQMLRSKYGRLDAYALAEELVNLPAETRFPDHTIWAHLDLAAAMTASNPVMVRIKISPVQNFIKNARKERDLWAGSHMLSYLTFQSLKPIIERFGPDAVIYPHMRGQPMFVAEFLGENTNGLEIANIPNKALAILPEADFSRVEREIQNAFKSSLREIYEFTAEKAKKELGINFDWAEYFHILENYFNLTIEKVPLYVKFRSYDEIIDFLERMEIHDERIKWFEMLRALSTYSPQPTELYPLLYEILESATNLKGNKFERREQKSGWKCRLCGENLAILGDKLGYGELMNLWENEPLCPVCLSKRYYREYLSHKKVKTVGFETTTDICLKAYGWIERFRNEFSEFYELLSSCGLVKNGEPCDSDMYYEEYWLPEAEKLRKKIHEWCKLTSKCELQEVRNKALEILRKAYEKIGKPPKYYAILKLDGDEMGKLLSGRKGENVSEFVHERLKEELKKMLESSEEKKFKDVKRILSPSLHIAVSQALVRFSVSVVPDVVRKNGGDLIYAGGDDVLAILPIDTAMVCAAEIAKRFSSAKLFAPWVDGHSGLTMSGGLLIVHYKHPLRDAIERVEELEKSAKDSGRNAFAIGYLARSGNYREAIVEWSLMDDFDALKEVVGKLPKRMLHEVLRVIDSLPEYAVDSYLKYELKRHCKDIGVGELLKLAGGIRSSDNKFKLKGLFTLFLILREVIPSA